MSWIRVEAGEYELRDGDRVLARVYREGPSVWRWVLEEFPFLPLDMEFRGNRTGLTDLAETAKVKAESAINHRRELLRRT